VDILAVEVNELIAALPFCCGNFVDIQKRQLLGSFRVLGVNCWTVVFNTKIERKAVALYA